MHLTIKHAPSPRIVGKAWTWLLGGVHTNFQDFNLQKLHAHVPRQDGL